MVILCVDLGLARTGLAICGREELLASPLCVIAERDFDILRKEIVEKALEHKAGLIVIGLPKNMDGTEGESAQRARAFGADLSAESGLPVDFCDERQTSVSAHNYLNLTNTRGKKRKAVVDAVSAVIILESYLERRKNDAQREKEKYREEISE